MDTFKNLISQFRNNKVSRDVLNEIKIDFESIIDSPRDYASIHSISDLISILDKRGQFGHFDVEILYKLAEKDDFKSLRAPLINYSREIIKCNLINDEKTRLLCMDLPLDVPNDHVIPQKVIDLLSSELNDSWIKMARFMLISDRTIDTIDSIETENDEKIKQMLDVYVREVSCTMKRGRLLNSLSFIKRNDLKSKVENIFKEPCNCTKNTRNL